MDNSLCFHVFHTRALVCRVALGLSSSRIGWTFLRASSMADHNEEYAEIIQAGTVAQTMDELQMEAGWKPFESKEALSLSGTVARPLLRCDMCQRAQMKTIMTIWKNSCRAMPPVVRSRGGLLAGTRCRHLEKRRPNSLHFSRSEATRSLIQVPKMAIGRR